MPPRTSKCIFLAPAPRIVSDIFDENDLLRLRDVGDVVIHEGGPVTTRGCQRNMFKLWGAKPPPWMRSCTPRALFS